jgi:putative flippase GtrA
MWTLPGSLILVASPVSLGTVSAMGSWRRSPVFGEYVGMLLAGGVPFAVALPVFAALVHSGANPVVANVAVLAGSAAVTFCLNHLVVFRLRRPPLGRSTWRFSLVVSATLFIDVAGVAAAAAAGASPWALTAAKLALVASGVLLRLVLFRHWVFTAR